MVSQPDKIYGRIYVIHCKTYNKFYVGQTIQLLRIRWRQHRKLSAATSGHGIISKAIQKHGRDSFSVHEVATASSKCNLDNLEKLWIILLRSSENKFGYNRTTGGDGSLTPEARQAMRVPRPQTALKLRGRKRPQHVLDILRNANLGRKHSAEWRSQHAIDMTGFRHTQKTKNKMSEVRKSFWERKRASLASVSTQSE
jgi:group I intron endonuclease